MEFSEIITPLLCVVSPFALLWIVFAVFVGIRTGWEAGVRLLLLGLGLLVAILVVGAIVFFLPNWAVIPLALIAALLPWIFVLRYFVNIRLRGRLIMALSAKGEAPLQSILNAMVFVLFGLSLFITNNDFLAPPKSYVVGLSLVSLGIFRATQRIRYSQIREKGILNQSGSFYRWDNIESYGWKFGEDKLTLKLKRSIFKPNVSLKLLSQYRQEAVAHLSQRIDNSTNKAEGYVPIRKAG